MTLRLWFVGELRIVEVFALPIIKIRTGKCEFCEYGDSAPWIDESGNDDMASVFETIMLSVIRSPSNRKRIPEHAEFFDFANKHEVLFFVDGDYFEMWVRQRAEFTEAVRWFHPGNEVRVLAFGAPNFREQFPLTLSITVSPCSAQFDLKFAKAAPSFTWDLSVPGYNSFVNCLHPDAAVLSVGLHVSRGEVTINDFQEAIRK